MPKINPVYSRLPRWCAVSAGLILPKYHSDPTGLHRCKGLPDGNLQLTNVSVPGYLVESAAEFQRADISIVNGCIAGVTTTALIDVTAITDHTATDLAGAIALPCFVDMHTHLDKGRGTWASGLRFKRMRRKRVRQSVGE